MTLEELKTLMGIDLEDTSQDAILSLYLEAALQEAQAYANAYDWTLTSPLPGPIKLGIVKWVEITRLKESRQGVVSESIGGMSQTFNTNTTNADLYSGVFGFWDAFRKKGVTFYAARRKNA